MKLFLALQIGMCILIAGAVPPAIPTNAPARIELKDQFEVPQTLCFPATNITFLTIADRKGSLQLADWIAPVKERFAERVDIRGIADVSAVPRLLRGMIRKRFQQAQAHSVMLDWSGDVVNAITYVPDQANVLVLDRQGNILKRLRGPATENALQELYIVLDHALAHGDAMGKP